MRKKLEIMICAGCMALTAASCPAAETKETDDLLHQIFLANGLDALMENHSNVSANCMFYDIGGSVVSSLYIYGDADLYVWEDSNSNVWILGNGEEYGFDSETSTAYHSLFMDGVYEPYHQDTRAWAMMQDWDEGQEYTSSEQDGVLTVEVTADAQTMKESNEEAEAIQQMEDTDSLIFQYQVDSKTLELLHYADFIEKQDGSRVEEETMVISYDGEAYEPTQELRDAVFGDDLRTITIIADPGTDQETTYTQTVTKGGKVNFYPADGYENLYVDEACTQMKEAELDQDEDATYYTKQE
ncbi:MAG: hypothetical protein PHE06_03985 [Lachnospiraceae bacterium]|nr:hypothetical protein [Lachnospiraceae bacterium]